MVPVIPPTRLHAIAWSTAGLAVSICRLLSPPGSVWPQATWHPREFIIVTVSACECCVVWSGWSVF